MTIQEKIALLEDMLELESGELNEEIRLDDIEDWDSMAKLSLIVLMEDEFNKKISGDQINKFETVKDVIEYMG